MTAQFELLFEGLADDSASTLRRLKGIFIADLDFPASDVQRFLENAPITIKSAGSENELKETYNLLQKAGAKVLIVKPDKTTLDPQSENSSLEPQALALEFDSVIGSTSKEVLAVDNSFNNSLELSLDFDTSPITSDPIKSIEITSNTPQKVEDSFDGPTFDLSFEEPESHTATTSTQLNSGSDVKSNQAEESLTQSNSNFGLELSLEENKQEAEKPAAFSSPVEEVLPQDLGLELDVVTPESSTLFGHHESSNHTEEPNDKVTATQSAIPGLTLPPVPALVAAPVSEIKVEQQPIINQSDPTTTAEEIPVELTWEQLKELQTPPSKPFKLSVIPILTILCLGILFYVNQIFFNSGSKENPFTTLIEQLPKISTEPSSEEQAKILAEKAADARRVRAGLSQKSGWYKTHNFLLGR